MGCERGLKMCATTSENKNYKSIIKNSLSDWNISHDKFALVNNALNEYGNMKGEIKNLKT